MAERKGRGIIQLALSTLTELLSMLTLNMNAEMKYLNVDLLLF